METRALSAAEVAQRVNIPNVLGASLTTGMTRVQPAKLVRGLALAMSGWRCGLCEDTAALSYAAVRLAQGPAARTGHSALHRRL